MSPAAYMDFFKQNDELIVRDVTVGNERYLIKLLTPEFFALKESSNLQNENAKADLAGRVASIKANTYFILDIYSNRTEVNNPTPAYKESELQYYQNEVQKRIKLTVDNDLVLTPSYVHFEDNYGLTPYQRILVCYNYDLDAIKSAMVIEYDDALLGNSNVRGKYSKQQIAQLPILKY